MGKIVLPDGSPANSSGIVGPSGEKLVGELPDNAPESIAFAVMFIKKLTEEVEFSGLAIVPLKDFLAITAGGADEDASIRVRTEMYLQLFASELKKRDPKLLETLKTTKELYAYMVSNYRIQELPPFGVNSVIVLNFEQPDGDQDDSTSVQSADSTKQD